MNMKFVKALVILCISLTCFSCGNNHKHEWSDVIDTMTYHKIEVPEIPIKKRVEAKTTRGSISISNVTVKSGKFTAQTDGHGGFSLDGIETVNGRAVISFEKDGYFSLTRSQSAEQGNLSDAKLQKKGNTENTSQTEFSSDKGSVIRVKEMMINIPSNTVVTEKGEPYNGTVKSDMFYLSPKNKNFTRMMPGGDMAAINSQGNDAMLYSFGMVDVMMTDSLNNPLQLSDTSAATLAFPVPEGMSTEVTSIPLWHFNESTGLWQEEGIAYRQGDLFVGKVGHFSWWNLDIPSERAMLKGKVVNQDGEAYPGLELLLDGQSSCVTNEKGEYHSYIPINKSFSIEISNQSNINSGDPIKIMVEAHSPQDVVEQNIVIPYDKIVTAKIIGSSKKSRTFKVQYEQDGAVASQTIYAKYGKAFSISLPKTAKNINISVYAGSDYAEKSVDVSSGDKFNVEIDMSKDTKKIDTKNLKNKLVCEPGKMIIVDNADKKHTLNLDETADVVIGFNNMESSFFFKMLSKILGDFSLPANMIKIHPLRIAIDTTITPEMFGTPLAVKWETNDGMEDQEGTIILEPTDDNQHLILTFEGSGSCIYEKGKRSIIGKKAYATLILPMDFNFPETSKKPIDLSSINAKYEDLVLTYSYNQKMYCLEKLRIHSFSDVSDIKKDAIQILNESGYNADGDKDADYVTFYREGSRPEVEIVQSKTGFFGKMGIIEITY